MKTIYVKFYNPTEVIEITSETTDEEIIRSCFRAAKYKTETEALMVYAETPGTVWSTLLDDSMSFMDIQNWIKEAYNHIKNHDIDWLEEHFV